MISEGMTISVTDTVTEDNTALALGSGSLRVYGTPAMVLLVERAAVKLLEGNLDGDMTSVGTEVSLEHIAPTPLGGEITCKLVLSKIDRKKIKFDIEVSDGYEVVGRGTHSRFIVVSDRFQKKADNKML